MLLRTQPNPPLTAEQRPLAHVSAARRTHMASALAPPAPAHAPVRKEVPMLSQAIMLVEDNPDDEALTLRALRRNNILNEIVVMRDGVEAIEYLLGNGLDDSHLSRALPQLILLDLKLPKVDGLEVLRSIRTHERTRLLPIVILTSSKEDQDLLAGYSLGANSYVIKPVDFVQFSEAIRQLGLYWLVLNEPPPAKR
jgi:two-component system, response regulator